MRGGAIGAVFVMAVAAIAVGATALRGRAANRRAAERSAEAPAQIVASSEAAVSDSAAVAPPVAPQGDAMNHTPAPLMPVVPPGESPLSPGVTAIRADSVVILAFDSPESRTRIPEKFEHFVRATLPAIYGPAVDSILAKLPEGGIARQGNLLSELPTRGVRIPISDAWLIRLYPETRPGQDGPLVIRYRVSVVSKGG